MKYRVQLTTLQGYADLGEFDTLIEAQTKLEIAKPGGLWANEVQYVGPKSLPGDMIWGLVYPEYSPHEKWLRRIVELESELASLKANPK